MRRTLRWLGRNSGMLLQIITVVAAIATPVPAVRESRENGNHDSGANS